LESLLPGENILSPMRLSDQCIIPLLQNNIDPIMFKSRSKSIYQAFKHPNVTLAGQQRCEIIKKNASEGTFLLGTRLALKRYQPPLYRMAC